MEPETGPEGHDTPPSQPRPQSLMLAFLGDYVLQRGICVAAASYIELFSRFGVSEHATRSTLARMQRRGLLRSVRRGRRVYYGLTERSTAILRDGGHRIWERGVVNEGSDGTWTLIGFSLPESWQRKRHELRTRLLWAGFGLLYSGLWIAPSRVDVSDVIDEVGVQEYAKVFEATPVAPTDIDRLVQDAFDLEGVAERYHAFLRRWDRPLPPREPRDALVSKLLLTAEWLGIVRLDPCLPMRHLPTDWPAPHAQRVFRRTHAALSPPAEEALGEILDTIEDR